MKDSQRRIARLLALAGLSMDTSPAIETSDRLETLERKYTRRKTWKEYPITCAQLASFTENTESREALS